MRKILGNKKNFLTILFLIIVIFFTFLIYQQKNLEIPKKYYKHFNTRDSKIIISCKKDSSCVLTKKILTPYYSIVSINKNSHKNFLIEEFNKKESEIYKNYKFKKCSNDKKLEDFVAVCIENKCGVAKK